MVTNGTDILTVTSDDGTFDTNDTNYSFFTSSELSTLTDGILQLITNFTKPHLVYTKYSS